MKAKLFLTSLAGLAGLAASANGAVTASNLVAYFDFNGTTDNQSGPTSNASLAGTAALTISNGGYSGLAGDEALDLGAVNDGAYAEVGTGSHFDSLTANNSFSVSFWQLNTGFGNTSAFWLNAPDATGNQRGAQAHTPWSNGTIYFDQAGCCGGPQRITTTGAVTDTWQHFVFQRDADGNREIWIDGALSASADGADSVSTFDGSFTIGAEGPTKANSFGGMIDEMAVWNTTLNGAEIGALAAGGSTTSLIPEPSGPLLGLIGLMTLGLRRRR
ncbi:MAG: LamG-like jellyroll fold domain-containing protein [Verrucomicrobiales bacterium]